MFEYWNLRKVLIFRFRVRDVYLIGFGCSLCFGILDKGLNIGIDYFRSILFINVYK